MKKELEMEQILHQEIYFQKEDEKEDKGVKKELITQLIMETYLEETVMAI